MGGIVKVIKGVLNAVVDVIASIVEEVWDKIVEPIMEEIVGLFGITDKLVIQVSKVSTKLYGQNVEEASKNATTKAVIGKAKDLDLSHSYFDHYWFQINQTKVSVTSYYRFGLTQYIHGIPDASIHGTSIDEVAIQNALHSAKGASATLLSSTSAYPDDLLHFQDTLQSIPYLYHPATDMLTYTETASGISYDDWAIAEVFFNVNNSNYEVTLTRQALIAEFWITGDANVVEGNTAFYRLHSTRIIPAGSPLTINLTYGGSALGSDYNAVASVQMLEGENEIPFSITTNNNTLVDGNREFSVSIGVIDNSGNIFQSVGAIIPSTVTTLIHDEDSPTLLVGDESVAESSSDVTLGVKLINTPGVGFTVDYATVAVTATAGADYVTTTGTLTFLGTLKEVQAIVVPIISDMADDSGETFNIVLSNCSEPSIDITSQGIVTITDESAGNPPSATVTASEILIQPNFVRKHSLITKYYDNGTDPLGLDWHYWLYEIALNTYPGLEPVSDSSSEFELFPIAVVRKDKVNLPDYGTAEELKSVDRLLKKLNLNIDEILASIDESPDISMVKDAYVNIGINPTDTGQGVSKLLYHLFHPVIAETPVASNQQKFFMTIEQDNIHNAVAWSAQAFNPSVVGSIGAVGDFNHTVSGTSLAVRKQISGTQYDEITVSNLNGMATIDYGGHHEMAANVLGDENFTLPVSWFSLNQLTPKEQMNVYHKIVRLDFYAVQETEIAWYATEAFMTFFQVVLVIITIVTAGLAAPATAGAATAVSAGATSTFLAIAQQMAINFVISQVVSEIAKSTGNEALAAIVGVVAAIAFAPGGSTFENLSGMFDAKSLLELSVDFADNLASSYEQTGAIESKELSEGIQEFNDLAEKRLDAIDDARYTPAVDIEFLAMVKSADTQAVSAISAVYQYDVLFDYDRIVSNYHDNLLQIGVV